MTTVVNMRNCSALFFQTNLILVFAPIEARGLFNYKSNIDMINLT